VRKIDTRDFRRATRTTSREINRRIVLNLVRDHQPLSRADLARRMEIGRGVVTSIVQELIDEGTIYEGDIGAAARGRRPTMLYVRTQDRYVIAVDVRFSRTFLMLSDFAGTQIAIDSFETIFDPEALTAELGVRIRRLVASHAIENRCEGVGLVVPGMVERTSGRIILAPQLGWRDVDMRDALAAEVGLPVSIENAPMACAQAQMWLGHRTNSTNFVSRTKPLPSKVQTMPAMRRMNEVRCRKRSAPSTPTSRTKTPRTTSERPPQDGATGMELSFLRLSHRRNAAKNGMRKP